MRVTLKFNGNKILEKVLMFRFESGVRPMVGQRWSQPKIQDLSNTRPPLPSIPSTEAAIFLPPVERGKIGFIIFSYPTTFQHLTFKSRHK